MGDRGRLVAAGVRLRRRRPPARARPARTGGEGEDHRRRTRRDRPVHTTGRGHARRRGRRARDRRQRRRGSAPQQQGQAHRRGDAHEPSDHRAHVLGTASGPVLLLGGEPPRQRRAGTAARRRLHDRDRRVVQVPDDERHLGGLHAGHEPAGHGPDHHVGREDRRLHRPLGARHDQSLHLLDRRPLPRDPGGRRPRPLGVEPPAHLPLPGRGRDRPLPGQPVSEHDVVRVRPVQGIRRDLLHRHQDGRALQPRARRRDGDHGQGPVRVRLRVAGLHGRHRRLRRCHPAVRLRSEPPGADRRRHPRLLVPRHDHPDDPHRRLRAAGEVDRHADRVRQHEVGRLGEPHADRRAERHQRLPQRVPAGAASSDPARQLRVHQRVERPFAAGPEPPLRDRARHHRRGAGQRRMDPLRRRHQHLRRQPRRRVRQPHLGQRGGPVRPPGPHRRADHQRRVPGPQHQRRVVEERARHGPGRLPVHLGPVPRPGGPSRGRPVPRHLAEPDRPVVVAQHGPVPRRRLDSRTPGECGPRGDRSRLRARPGVHGRSRDPGHRLAQLPGAGARHAQLPPVVRRSPAPPRPRRRRLEPGHLVHRRQRPRG